MAKIVRENISTALIMEDDADWDARIRQQLRDFALSSRSLIQPLISDKSKYADPTYPSPHSMTNSPLDLKFDALPSTTQPLSSPYGDGWDVLWLGHCGVNFPDTEPADSAEKSKNLPKGRVVHLNDETVPEPRYLKMHAEYEDPLEMYPPHSRIVHHAMGSICSLVYAVTQASARRILYNMGIKSFEAPFDLMLRDHCQGSGVRSYHPCLTVQPQLFNHHRPAGKKSSESDISDHGTGYREKPITKFIRWSVRMNLERYLNGEEDYEDQFPDGNP
ncbi:hypothetical protein GP486_000411 [Trichoglossum hirsutum]|uniref:Glycosyltransferase family 25 protein n=1 Tax=Trichoglossum hirsutum TaxID=265104 RepID=A0A9P8LIM3_9PEZI|nr:hypothetical protein GP486_000411 [Trichoglossum hirsutum]